MERAVVRNVLKVELVENEFVDLLQKGIFCQSAVGHANAS
jgi:hypothetical protein